VIWRFADCELDEERCQLRRRSRVVRIEPRVFDVLLHLLRHRERVVSKDELLAALWPGLSVSDSVLPRCVAEARRAVGDVRERKRVIETCHGRGYRFVAKAEASEAAPTPAAGTGAPAFVGRDDTLHVLRAALDHALAGSGRVVLIVGEPGIGKTRTLEELAVEARRRGMRWRAGRCFEAEGAPPFRPFASLLRDLPQRGSDDPLRALVAEGTPLDVLGAAGGEQARFRWFDAVASELRRAAARAPLLLSVDDLHAADGDSLRLFLFLARELADAAVVLAGTYRDVEVRRGHALARLLGDLAREPHVQRVTLRGLAPAEVASLAASVVGAPLDAALATALSELTEGNPFFVQEMARWLRDQPRARGTPSLSLPQGVRDAVGRRLDALSERANALLRVAAVIGREFTAPLLTELAGADAVLESLSEAAAAGILQRDAKAPGRFGFSHTLLRQTLYEELPVAERVALHRRIAEALERAGEAPPSELAHHWFEALPSGAAAESVRASVAAAEAGHERLAYDESARHYARAVEALAYARPPDDGARAELLIALGEELWTGGDRERGRTRLAEAAELARRIGRKDLLARAAIGYRGFGEMGMPPDAKTLALLEEARDALGEGAPILRARLLARLAGTPPYSHSLAQREALAREAWRLAQHGGDRAALVDAISARYWATLGPDRLGDRLAVAEAAFALAERSGDRRLALLAHEIAIGHHLVAGDLTGADREIAAYDRLADEVRQPVFRFLAGLIRAGRALSAGEFEQAEHWMREALARGRGTIPYADAVFAGQQAALFFLRGESDRMAQLSLALGEELGRRFSGADTLNGALTIAGLLRLGRPGEARDRYEALAARDFADIERDEHWLITMDALADLAVELDDRRRSEILYERLLPYRGLLVSHDLLRVVTETVEGVLGVLALHVGRVGDAIEHLERGVERAEKHGLRPALRLAQLGLAKALVARAGRGDRARARRVLARAAKTPVATRRRAENVAIPSASPRDRNLEKSSGGPRDPRRAR
jgi:DNA-binding winged helix-turn-helix (wHTH) protein